METTAQRKRRAAAVLRRLQQAYPNAGCELRYANPLELAVAAILSAQCTDKRVNRVTPGLFEKYRTAADWAGTPQAVLEREIHSTGFFRNKARNIRALARQLDERHGGMLPDTFDVLVGLPGIGHKTANLLVAEAFGGQGLIVDTHCKRLSHRLGFSREDHPDKIERDLAAIVPRKHWTAWSHCMVFHGRYCCAARKPACDRCPVSGRCPHYAAQGKPSGN